MDLQSLSRQELEDLALAAHEMEVRDARRSSSAFVDLAFGYESEPFQRAWHDALAAHNELVVFAPIEHGKTQQISIGYPIWKLGKQGQARGLLIGNTAGQAEKTLAVIRRQIDENPIVREVFPELKPLGGKFAKWTDQAIRLATASLSEKDYSLATCGVMGPILGARLDFAILDDVLDFENTRTKAQREKVIQWFEAVLLGRIVDGGQVVIAGNAWFPDDLMHILEQRGFHVIRDEAYRELADGSIDPASILWKRRQLAGGTFAGWSLERLAKKIKLLGIVEALRQFRCKPYSSGRGQFKLEWFDQAFERGADLEFEYSFRGLPTVCGVDLGVHEKESSDLSVFWVMAIEPDETRRVLWIEAGRLEGPAIVAKLIELRDRYDCRIMVENNAAQAYIEQFAREAGVLVEGFTTGKQKADPRFGVPSIAVELERRMWRLPKHEEAYAFRAECLAYSPGEHTGDRLMACWFAREAARMAAVSGGVTIEPEEGTRSGVSYGRLRARYDGGRARRPGVAVH